MDEGHVRTVLDVLVVTHDVDSVLAGLLGPVLDVTRSIILVVILNLRLGGAFNGKPWGEWGDRWGAPWLHGEKDLVYVTISSLPLPAYKPSVAQKMETCVCPFLTKPSLLSLH